MLEVELTNEDVGHLSAGGGSNVIGSIQQFDMKGREEGQVNNLDFNMCASN